MKVSWKNLRDQFKDGEAFLIEFKACEYQVMFINEDTASFINLTKYVFDDYNSLNIVNWNRRILNLIDWFEEPAISVVNTDECSTNSRCGCFKCISYDKLYGT